MGERLGLSAGVCGGLMLAVALAGAGGLAMLASAALVAAWLLCLPSAGTLAGERREELAWLVVWVLAAPVGTLVGAGVGWRPAAVLALAVCLAAVWTGGLRAGRALLGWA